MRHYYRVYEFKPKNDFSEQDYLFMKNNFGEFMKSNSAIDYKKIVIPVVLRFFLWTLSILFLVTSLEYKLIKNENLNLLGMILFGSYLFFNLLYFITFFSMIVYIINKRLFMKKVKNIIDETKSYTEFAYVVDKLIKFKGVF